MPWGTTLHLLPRPLQRATHMYQRGHGLQSKFSRQAVRPALQAAMSCSTVVARCSKVTVGHYYCL